MLQDISARLAACRARLAAAGQEHLLAFVETLAPEGQERLLSQIEALDWTFLQLLIEQYVLNEPQVALDAEVLPPLIFPQQPTAELAEKYRAGRALGESLIAAGKVAAFTVAGGQGTRLGFAGPKGNYPATPIKGKPLFQVFAEGIRAVQRAYGAVIPWYVMTSPANHDETVASFEAQGYFGLDPANVRHFAQGMMPSFSRDGKILLAEPDGLALSPDGHGGSLRALHKSGALADMERRGVEYISYFQVDNPLVYPIDPLFIGLHALEGAEMSSKAVQKADPFEKVGNFTLVNGRVTVIEYSDLPDELAERRRPDGSLMFQAGSIAIHIINRAFVSRLNAHGFSLPWHRAVKRVPYVGPDGRTVAPAEPNAVKLETFVFDALPLAEKSIILEIDRREQFAPIKNASGTDSVESSHCLQIERAARWLEQAGVAVPRQDDGSADAVLEISPLAGHCPEALAGGRHVLPERVSPGASLYIGDD